MSTVLKNACSQNCLSSNLIGLYMYNLIADKELSKKVDSMVHSKSSNTLDIIYQKTK
jgi:hypothetical protein